MAPAYVYLSEVHASRLPGHFGVLKPYDVVCFHYWCPWWHVEVDACVKECNGDQRKKSRTHKFATVAYHALTNYLRKQ